MQTTIKSIFMKLKLSTQFFYNLRFGVGSFCSSNRSSCTGNFVLRHSKLINAIFSTLFLFVTVFSVVAEGSATLYPSGATGKRASLNVRSRTVPRLFDIFPTPGTMKVFVKAGETLYVGSSAQGISQTYGTPAATYTGTINLRAPNGTTYSSGTSTTVGLIANRTEELAGPDRTGITTGYTPYTRIVESAEEGIWEVDFVPPTNPDTTSVPQYDVDANASWIQQKRAMIVAWDVSVGSASSPATLIPGRVYMNNFNGNLASIKVDGGSSAHRLDVTLYVLTDAGYKFRVKTNGFNGKSFNFFVNNKGIQDSTSTSVGSSVNTTPLTWKNGNPSYKSRTFTSVGGTRNMWMYDPREPDNNSGSIPDITHKIFYNTPATDMPASAPIRYNGGAATTTWLNPSTYPDAPTISNLSVVGVESGTAGLVGPDGAYIQFTSNVPGNYSITLTFSTGTTRTLTGNCVAGLNQIPWDGKNGSGATVSSSVTVTAQNTVKSGEMHFPFEDVEINPNGIIIELLQSDNSLFSPTRDLVYWNDTGLSGGNPSSPLENSTTGSSSNSNGHKWGIYAISDIENQFGNNTLLDTWTYVKGSATSPVTTISYKSLDLAVSSITPSVSSVVVGNTITYTIVVTNPSSTGFTDDALGASFGFTAPTGFNITSATAVQNSGTFSETSRSAVSGNTFTSVFNLTSNGQVTYTITGTVGATMAHTSAAATTYVMRPADYTDLDATSAIIGAPTNPELECDGGTSGAGCNNINTTTITVTNTVPVAVNDAGTVDEDATLTVTEDNGVIKNATTGDSDVDGDVLTVIEIRTGNVEGSGTAGTVGSPLTGTYGQLTLNANGSYTYVANNATALNAGDTAYDYFSYTISDGYGGTDIATITITINGNNEYCAWRSQKSDVWSDNTVWEGLNCTTGLWENVPFAPNNDRPIYVFHTVDIPASTTIAADSLYVKPGGIVSVPATSTLTVTDQLIIGIDKDGVAGQLLSNRDCDNISTSDAKIIVRKAVDNTWDFISFPFSVIADSVFIAGTRTSANWGDISPSTANADFYAAQYDGAARAISGSPSATIGNYWKNVTGKTFVPVRGYIISGGNRGADSLDFVATANTQLAFCNGEYEPENFNPDPKCNGGWNLVGTPYVSAYDLIAASPYKAYYVAPAYTPVANNIHYTLNAFGAFFMQATAAAPVTYPVSVLPQGAPRLTPKYNNLELAINNTVRSNKTLVRLAEDANVNYQLGEDAMNLNINASAPQIYSEASGACTGLAVNTLPLNTERVDLKIRIATVGAYTIKLTNKDMLNNIKAAILVDTETGLQTDLINSEDGYTFDATATGTSSRFYILLSPNISTIIDRNGNEDIDVIIKGKNISLSGLNGKAGVRMYDVVGKLMYKYNEFQNGQSFDVNVPGVYLMDINTKTQDAKIKVLIQN